MPEIPYHLHTPETDLPVDFDEPCAHPDCGHARREHRPSPSSDNAMACRGCSHTPNYLHDFLQGVTRQ